MSLWRAAAYFFGEAFRSLMRSWKVSLLALLTIAVSLYVFGAFWIVSRNLSALVDRSWVDRQVVVYLDETTKDQELAALVEWVEGAEWTTSVQRVSSKQAQERLEESFPGIREVLSPLEDSEPSTDSAASAERAEFLPASLEIALLSKGLDSTAYDRWLEDLAERPGAAFVEDDRDWLLRLAALVRFIRGAGFFLGAVLLAAAVFIIGSVIRLTAYLYQEEIAIMRLVGATEFFIRGPFYVEGLLQGLLGGVLAVFALLATFSLVNWGGADQGSLLQAVLLSRFLGAGQCLSLVSVGAAAGGIGALVSLRREDLGPSIEPVDAEL